MRYSSTYKCFTQRISILLAAQVVGTSVFPVLSNCSCAPCNEDSILTFRDIDTSDIVLILALIIKFTLQGHVSCLMHKIYTTQVDQRIINAEDFYI